MKTGQKVYTVNGATNKVDTWEYAGALPTRDELVLCLKNGNKYCHLPKRCVFENYEDALAVANNHK